MTRMLMLPLYSASHAEKYAQWLVAHGFEAMYVDNVVHVEWDCFNAYRFVNNAVRQGHADYALLSSAVEEQLRGVILSEEDVT